MNIHVAHDPILVGFALLIAILGAFTALYLVARARENEGNAQLMWLSMAAIAVGGGIFTMHFIAMLACDMGEMFIAYKMGMMLTALGVAVLCSGIGIGITLRFGSGALSLLAGGLFMGLGMAGMHYLGAASMVLAATAIHDPLYTTVSVIISVFASILALWLSFKARTALTRLGSAVAMCAGIAGVHFVGIGATHYEILPDIAVPARGLPVTVLAIVVGIATIALLALALSSALVDQHLARRASEEAARLQAAYSDLERKVEKRTSELRVAKEAAEAANLANMSHELRTPFNAIMGYAQMLRADMAADGNVKAADDLAQIEDASQHLLGLINEILDLAKIEAGKATLVPKPVDLSDLVARAAGTVRPLMEKGNNKLAIEIAPGIGLVTIDVQKTTQCLLNVLSNAAKFTTDGSIALAVERAGDMLEFEVADTGIGLSKEDQIRVFASFVQADDSLSRSYDGSGLGLTITHHLCGLMGGSIQVKSTPGQGSLFCFSIKADQIPLMNMELAPCRPYEPAVAQEQSAAAQ